jgi:hypothetical protein
VLFSFLNFLFVGSLSLSVFPRDGLYDVWDCRMVTSFGGCRSVTPGGTPSNIFEYLMRYDCLGIMTLYNVFLCVLCWLYSYFSLLVIRMCTSLNQLFLYCLKKIQVYCLGIRLTEFSA